MTIKQSRNKYNKSYIFSFKKKLNERNLCIKNYNVEIKVDYILMFQIPSSSYVFSFITLHWLFFLGISFLKSCPFSKGHHLRCQRELQIRRGKHTDILGKGLLATALSPTLLTFRKVCPSSNSLWMSKTKWSDDPLMDPQCWHCDLPLNANSSHTPPSSLMI